MQTIDGSELASVTGGGMFPKRLVLQTIEQLYPGRIAPYAEWTTWGAKKAGEAAPAYGHPDGIHYTFWGRPARDAIVVNGPRGVRD